MARSSAALRRFVHGDQVLSGGVRVHDLDRALDHDEELGRDLALIEQDLTGVERALGADAADAFELGRVERRERLGRAGRRGERSRSGGHLPHSDRNRSST